MPRPGRQGSDMVYDARKHHRRSIRWFAYDYTQAGAYFVTICTADRQGPLGWVEGTEMRLSALGQIAEACWQVIPEHFEDVVMPNHVHGIVVIGDGRARHAPASARAGAAVGGSIVAAKSSVWRRQRIRHAGAALWQRTTRACDSQRLLLSRIRRYIEGNPAN